MFRQQYSFTQKKIKLTGTKKINGGQVGRTMRRGDKLSKLNKL